MMYTLCMGGSGAEWPRQLGKSGIYTKSLINNLYCEVKVVAIVEEMSVTLYKKTALILIAFRKLKISAWKLCPAK